MKILKKILLLIFCFSFCAANILALQNKKKYLDGEVIIKFKSSSYKPSSIQASSVPSIDIENFKKKYQKKFNIETIEKNFKTESSKKYHSLSFKQKQSLNNLNMIYKIKYNTNQDAKYIANQLSYDSNIEWAQPSYIYYPFETEPDDALYLQGYQWALDGSTTGYIDTKKAWDITTGASSVVVAVIDNGVQLNHQDLESRIWTNSNETPDNDIDDDLNGFVDDVNGWDFGDNDKDPNPTDYDTQKHGSVIASIIGAHGNDARGVTGVTWDCRLMTLKCAPNTTDYLINVDQAVNYAVNNGAKIINMSFGSDEYDAALEAAIETAYSNNVIMLASSGNEGEDTLNYPAKYDEVISVGATGKEDKLDKHNDIMYSNYNQDLDLVAPGNKIASVKPDPSVKNYYFIGTGALTGTSMATAITSGVAALVCAVKSNITPNQMKLALRNTADKIDYKNLQYKGKIGGGRVNAYWALKEAQGADGTPPQVSISVDAEFSSQIEASWTGSDPESSIDSYHYNIGKKTSAYDYSLELEDWVNNGTNTSLSYKPDNLTVGSTYFVLIKAINGSGVNHEAIYISDETVYTGLALNYLIDGLGDEDIDVSNSRNTISAKWSFKEATKYYYEISTNPNLNITNFTNSTFNTYCEVVMDGGLTNRTTYYVYVKAENSNGDESDIYRTDGVYITRGPTYNYLIDGLGDEDIDTSSSSSTIKAKWSFNNADKYYYKISTNPSLNPPNFKSSTTHNYINAKSKDGLENKTTYYVYVQAIDKYEDESEIYRTDGVYIEYNFSNEEIKYEEDVTIKTDYGIELLISSNTFSEDINLEIKKQKSSLDSIDAANNNIEDAELKSFAFDSGIFYEFTALSKTNGNKITNLNKPITIKISYTDDDNDLILDGTETQIKQLAIYSLDESKEEWIRLENVWYDYENKTVNALIEHFSIYSVLKTKDKPSVSQIIVYPNPCRINKQGYLKLGNLPNDSNTISIKIYDIRGKFIKKLDTNNLVKKIDGNVIEWDGKNKNGSKVASGVYLFLINYNGEKKKEKVAILW
jgi:subtilisin family serine protease